MTKHFLKAAWLFGLAPLGVGITIFLLWLLFRSRSLASAGLLTLPAGVLSLVLGLICLLIWKVGTLRSKEAEPSVRRPVAKILLLYVANFAAAAACLFAGYAVEACYTVWILNESVLPIDSAHLYYGPQSDIPLGSIAIGKTLTRRFYIHTDGTLIFEAIQSDGSKITATVDGYVTGNIGAYKIITIDPDGKPHVRDKRPGLIYR
jgi:hypothetical protein